MSDDPKNDNSPSGFATGPDLRGYGAEGLHAAGADGEATGGGEHQADYEAFMRLVKDNEELKDRLLRTAADMENLRRRNARDVADARAYAIANFARDMLAVSDNLGRAMDAVPEEAKASGDGGFKALIEGVELTERAMLSALERHGVKRIDPKGERFDPNFHQAMFEAPDETLPHNTVTSVVQAGYSIGDRVLRPAMVGVSRGGPKTPQPTASQTEPSAPAEPGPPNGQAEKDA